MNLSNKNVLLAVTGGVAAYKAPDLVRRLRDAGAAVKVVMTESACAFIQPLTFQAVSGHEVQVDLLDERAEAAMGHIELSRWADLLLVAPATANTLARMAGGIADDLIATLYLATRSPVAVAPSMNNAMWEHPATQSNLARLSEHGVVVLGPAVGAQACGEFGPGRMLEPTELVAECAGLMAGKVDSASRLFDSATRILLTAGPTRERIDPVRFISNHSSGKMGFALAGAAADAGASVTLVSGPVHLDTPSGVQRVDVDSALQMHQAVMDRVAAHDIFIAVAAVADYRVVDQQDRKIKKTDGDLSLSLARNPDILADVATGSAKPFCVGFAAETNNVESYARDKLDRKNLDMIVANQVGVEGNGFNSDTNAVSVFFAGGGSRKFASQDKRQLARKLIDLIAEQFNGQHQND